MTTQDHGTAFICSHIFQDIRPILLVAHEDGDWMFLCGDEHDFEADLPHVVGLNHLLERDQSLKLILDLSDGQEAERDSVSDPWRRRTLT